MLKTNQFEQISILGELDLSFNTETVSVVVDDSEVTELVAGQFVKVVDSESRIPKVVAVAAASDEAHGVINYSRKDSSFAAGDALEISRDSNVMFLTAAGPITRMSQVVMSVATPGSVDSIDAGAAGDVIVGHAYDKAVAAGDLIRVVLSVPSFKVKA